MLYQNDQNLILAHTNSLKIYRLTEIDIEFMYEIPIQEHILDVIRIPTESFYKVEPITSIKKAGRLSRTRDNVEVVQQQ